MESFRGTLEVGNSPLEGEQFEKNHIFNYDKGTGLSKKRGLNLTGEAEFMKQCLISSLLHFYKDAFITE